MATWLHFDGTGGSARATDSEQLSFAGDLDFRARVRAPDYSPGTVQTIAAKRTSQSTASQEFQWAIPVAPGQNQVLSVTDTTPTDYQDQKTSTTHPGVDGEWLWLRVTLDLDDGAGNRVYTWYYSTDPVSDITAVTWVQHDQQTVAGAITALRTDVATLAEIGAINLGANQEFVGDIQIVELRDGIGGTVRAHVDLSDLALGQTSYTDAQGTVWSFVGDGVTIGGLAFQLVYPAAIVEANGWTGAATDIDEPATPNDADFIESPVAPTTAQPVVLRAQAAINPGVDTSHQYVVRAWANVISGTPTVTVTPVWRTGYVDDVSRGTIIKTGAAETLTAIPTDFTLSLTSAEAAGIPDAEYSTGVFCELIPEQT